MKYSDTELVAAIQGNDTRDRDKAIAQIYESTLPIAMKYVGKYWYNAPEDVKTTATGALHNALFKLIKIIEERKFEEGRAKITTYLIVIMKGVIQNMMRKKGNQPHTELDSSEREKLSIEFELDYEEYENCIFGDLGKGEKTDANND